jgi:hypothetical protein
MFFSGLNISSYVPAMIKIIIIEIIICFIEINYFSKTPVVAAYRCQLNAATTRSRSKTLSGVHKNVFKGGGGR